MKEIESRIDAILGDTNPAKSSPDFNITVFQGIVIGLLTVIASAVSCQIADEEIRYQASATLDTLMQLIERTEMK